MKLRKYLVLCPFEELRTEGKRHNRFLQMRTHKIQSVTLTRNYLFVFILAMSVKHRINKNLIEKYNYIEGYLYNIYGFSKLFT